MCCKQRKSIENTAVMDGYASKKLSKGTGDAGVRQWWGKTGVGWKELGRGENMQSSRDADS